jgi:hypothetical protein
MKAWATYSGRLLWAMQQAGKTNQSELARVIGVRPQSIQYLCRPGSSAQGSSHTPALARELGVLADWLARGEGQPFGVEHSATTLRAESPAAPYGVATEPMAEVQGYARVSGLGDVQLEPRHARRPGGHVVVPLGALPAKAWCVRGQALEPYVKDGQFLVTRPAGQEAEPEDMVMLRLKDGRILVRELMVRRDDAYVVLSVHGGQPELIDLQDLAGVDVILCVLAKRWWRPPAMHQGGP